METKDENDTYLKRLSDSFDSCESGVLAVSGGVDSMLLALIAFNEDRKNIEIFHAVSPAVQSDGTDRVKQFSMKFGWPLRIINSKEFDDKNYISNPVNRCFFCKKNLYKMLRMYTKGTIFSGTNCDDLRDYRPGLEAAKIYNVRHPFVEAGMSKEVIRRLARDKGFLTLAELPSQPCLSSRIVTGTPISPEVLGAIYSVELWIGKYFRPATVRCRFNKGSVDIQLDDLTLRALSAKERGSIKNVVKRSFHFLNRLPSIDFSLYRMGSAVKRYH